MAFVLLQRFLLLFIPKNKITAEQKLRFLSKTGVRNGKYRNPEDSGRNMQPNKTKKKPWHWDEVHQKAFDNVKATVVKHNLGLSGLYKALRDLYRCL